jgi:predicted DNA-binding protein YlxM (UPF0122 family)
MGRKKQVEDTPELRKYALGHTVPECADYFGVSCQTMRNSLKRYGIQAAKYKVAQPIKYERNQAVVEMHSAGFSFEKIARKFGISRQRVFQICQSYYLRLEK